MPIPALTRILGIAAVGLSLSVALPPPDRTPVRLAGHAAAAAAGPAVTVTSTVRLPRTWKVRTRSQLEVVPPPGARCTLRRWKRATGSPRRYGRVQVRCQVDPGTGAVTVQVRDRRRPERALHVVLASAAGSSAQPSGRASDHTFMLTQDQDPTQPVGWDPCQPIDLALSRGPAPAGEATLVREAVQRVAQASGLPLRLTDQGLADPVAALRTPPADADIVFVIVSARRTGPVSRLAGWPEEWPGIVGVGSMWASRVQEADWSWATGGSVIIDWDVAATMPGGTRGTRISSYLHEIGHALGLGHAEDPTQVMYPVVSSRNAGGRWGAGDLAGLAALAHGRCRP